MIANCRDIQQLDPTIKEIENGQITIQGSSSKFLSSELTHLSDQPVLTCDYNFSTAEEKSGYKHWFVIASYPTGSSTHNIIDDLGLSTDDIPVDNDLIAEWLDIAPEQWEKNFSNFVFVIPIYIKRTVLSKDENKVFATYEVHKSFVNKCTLTKKISYGKPKRSHTPLSELPLKKVQGHDAMTFTEKIIEATDISKEKIVGIEIMHKSLYVLFYDNFNYDNLRQFEKPLTPNYLQKLLLDITTHSDLFNFNLNSYPNENAPKVHPFEAYVYYLFSQLFPCIWFGLFENANFIKKVLQSNGLNEEIVDFVLLDKQKNGSIILIACIRQFLSTRSVIGEYETEKLTHVKTFFERQSYDNVHAILVCAELYDSNPILFDTAIQRFGKQVCFLFREDLNEIQSNIHTITAHDDILGYSRNSKLNRYNGME